MHKLKIPPEWIETEAGQLLEGAPCALVIRLLQEFCSGRLEGTCQELEELVTGERRIKHYGLARRKQLRDLLGLDVEVQPLPQERRRRKK